MQNTELVKKNIDIAVTSSLPKVPDNFNNTDEKVCENCHITLQGPFCAQCGQNSESTLKYFWTVILHLLDDILSFDSRAIRTLFPLITRPGFLTTEYIAGKRVHYVPPLRLYLFISIVFFLTLNFIVASENSIKINVDDNQNTITEIKEKITLLEKDRLLVIQESPNNTEELLRISNDITKYSTYLNDINEDESVGKNKSLVNLTRALADIELTQLNDNEPFTEKIKERHESLITNISKLKNGNELDEIDKAKNSINFSNGKDGTVSFDFLSDDSNKKLNQFSQLLVKKAEKAFRSDAAPLVQEAISKLPQLMFILLPLFAVLLKIMFLFSKRLYMEHLTVALHSHSFIFFTVLIVELLDIFSEYCEKTLPSITGITEFAIKALLIWIPIYLFMMQKRVYKQGYFLTFVKYGFIGIAYIVLIALTGVIAFIWGLTDI
jgi:hypothetical protein